MRRGLQQGWQKNLLTFLLRDKAFMNVFHNTKEGDVDGLHDTKEVGNVDADAWWHSELNHTWRAKLGYYCYKSLDSLPQHLLIGYPILVVICDGNHVCAVMSEKTLDNKVMINLRFKQCHSVVNDLAYWEWSVDTGLATIFQVLEQDWVCGIMLPLLINSKSFPPNTGDMRYALVDEEWRELKKDGHFYY
jgi:hypothetical protein